ncbi:MAG TPA: hypothetical protein VN872_12815 [Candidatus Acidoferrum sp.]|nr:hypothetical protein [Candidatus Acidoferrum sp.]
MKKQTKPLIFLLIAILSFFFLSRHQKGVARRQEEARKTAAEAGAINTRALSYADSLTRIDPDPSHILLGGGGRPWLLGTPYPTQGEVERVIGRPSSVASEGARVWLYKPVPRINPSGATVYDESSTMLELWFDQADGRLSRMTIHKEGETTIGRNGREYEKHLTYSVPTVPNSR